MLSHLVLIDQVFLVHQLFSSFSYGLLAFFLFKTALDVQSFLLLPEPHGESQGKQYSVPVLF